MRFEDARAIVHAGFRRAARPVGQRWIIGAGRQASVKPHMPTPADVERVRDGLLRDGSFVAMRMLATMALSETLGLRAVSLAAINGSDFAARGAALFLVVTEKASKGKRGRQERRVPDDTVPALVAYVAAAAAHRRARTLGSVGFGLPGPFLRSTRGGRWREAGILAQYQTVCDRFEVPRFTPHGLRRLYATGLCAGLPTYEAAIAGDWSERILLQHYARPMKGAAPIELSRQPSLDLDDFGPFRTAIDDEASTPEKRNVGGSND